MIAKEGVERMKFDRHLVTGIFIGMLLGLHYQATLIGYLPILVVLTVILTLKLVNR